MINSSNFVLPQRVMTLFFPTVGNVILSILIGLFVGTICNFFQK